MHGHARKDKYPVEYVSSEELRVNALWDDWELNNILRIIRDKLVYEDRYELDRSGSVHMW